MEEVALSFDGVEENINDRRLHLLLCGCFLFHDSELNHKGPVTDIVLDHAEAAASEGALQKGVKVELRNRTYNKLKTQPDNLSILSKFKFSTVRMLTCRCLAVNV